LTTRVSPPLELDGYYLVVHLTDRPNLRRRSLAFLAEDLPRAFRLPAVLKGHGFELAYDIASILFGACLTGYSILMYRLTILPWLRSTFSPTTTTAVGWTLAAIVGAATLGAIVGTSVRPSQHRGSSGLRSEYPNSGTNPMTASNAEVKRRSYASTPDADEIGIRRATGHFSSLSTGCPLGSFCSELKHSVLVGATLRAESWRPFGSHAGDDHLVRQLLDGNLAP
jgi:hypothetical protein